MADWAQRLSVSQDRVQAAHLYAGRGFAEALRASAALGGEMLVISAGLGAVRSTTLVPPYSMSVVSGSVDEVLQKLSPPATAQTWWSELSTASPFDAGLPAVLASSSGCILVALSESYLRMVTPQLADLESDILARVRLLTRTPSHRIAPELQPHVMPYDDRLDGPDSSARGTRGDFATRAARDFAEEILPHIVPADLDSHRKAVVDRLSNWRHPPIFSRTRLTDDEVMAILHERWEEAGGQSSRLLRVLRDDLQVACEQGRFVGLMNRVRHERELAA
jgi:hypothetical protein